MNCGLCGGLETITEYGEKWACPACKDKDEIIDDYGNTESEPFKYCTFPDCGCDGVRLCQAKNGPNSASITLNIEKRSLNES